ncbi:DctP family TRAP transporter solute-binding subunit [Reinekea marinisedimentorum]|uniref:C4-dicarboxylate-binding protein DctP n=1 Tax=Reinekea marinisedimentorum TaxID=230495 RepID=A0A4R3I609_9GAMM|nr:DctP family TRAP transporter solute-binding subunit [Reinekea marinisedimentorum]TCS40207.1 C4-dicarboxylate-binding protein DctP [Reinekea marinisedimentorum]
MRKLLAVILFTWIPLTALAEPVNIKFSLIVSEETPAGKGAALFQQLVSERLPGQVEVEVYYNSELYSDADQLAALEANDVQILAPSMSKLGSYTDELKIFDIPFLFNDFAAVQQFWKKDASTPLLGSMADHGIIGLDFWGNGMKQITANKEIHMPEDANGLSFRIQDSQMISEQYQHIGVEPVPMAFGKTYESLENGTVQGTENTWSNIYTQKYQQVQPYMTETNHGVIAYMVITNTEFWWSLPFGVKVALTGILEEVSTYVNEQAYDINQAAMKQLKSNSDTQIISLTSEEKVIWKQQYKSFIDAHKSTINPNIYRAAEMSN